MMPFQINAILDISSVQNKILSPHESIQSQNAPKPVFGQSSALHLA